LVNETALQRATFSILTSARISYLIRNIHSYNAASVQYLFQSSHLSWITFQTLASDENLFCCSENIFFNRSNESILYSLLFYKFHSWVLFRLIDASKSVSCKCFWIMTQRNSSCVL
jgi:hypothetical protein